MDIRDLQCVLEIVRRNSFTKAAEALHITQPTISKTVKNLEDELGVRLFIRGKRGMELTDAGQIVARQAQEIVQSFGSLTAELHDLTELRKGSIRIGLPPMVGSKFFPGVMSGFRQRYPGIAVHMMEDGSKKLEEEVAAGSLDAAAVLLPVSPDLFELYPFLDEKLMLVVHPRHPLADRREVAMTDLAEEAFILFREDFALHDRILAECARAGFQPRVLVESSQWDFIAEMAAGGLGIGLLPETICAGLDPKRVHSVALTGPEIPWRVTLIWRKEGYLSFAAKEWIRFAKTTLAGPAVENAGFQPLPEGRKTDFAGN
ncbi:LysR family transcriptional regulator [Paenibacillus humicola]|uniref:LysR family transcriptional regulator n=1 Tax=Paenibacillus humicola TaxID=3110540 RepID=UPI00237A616C|nr:LysR family transcriptional regulator [Paenibacillus humicola]